MDPVVVGLLCIPALGVLICLHVPIAFSMIVVGMGAFALQAGLLSAGSVVSSEVVTQTSNIDLSTIPLFLIMGTFANAAGFSREIYNLASSFLGHRRGGLAYATIGGSAAFGSICGSSPATAATFARVGLPEMERHGYDPAFGLGCIAAGGTLKALIPPSLAMILYSITAKVFIFEMFAAAVVPALLTIGLNLVAIWLVVLFRPALAPKSARVDWRERALSLKAAFPAISLLGTVFIGLYSGIFTVNEAASFAAVLSFLTMLARRRASWAEIRHGLYSAGTTTGMVFGILIGSAVFGYPINLAQLPNIITNVLAGLSIAPIFLITAILLFYLVLGAVFDELAAMLMTLPLILPVIVKLGYDPIWWGIVNVVVIELGLIIPPVGLIVFLLHGMVPQVSLTQLYRTVTPFIIADVVVLIILVLFPAVALFLPSVLY